MRVLISGATGAIGQPLIKHLLASGHSVSAITRSANAARIAVNAGAEAVQADALDSDAISQAVATVRPDVIINQLTSLPKVYTPEAMKAAADRDRRVRQTGNTNLLAAAKAMGVQRYILQSSAFLYVPGHGLAEETEPFATDAAFGAAAVAQRYADLEMNALAHQSLEVVCLRYGFFYGPGTWYSKDGDMGEQVRRMRIPVVEGGQGVWSFVHIDDAARATADALSCSPGVYNIVESEPVLQSVWLPAFARYIGASAPLQMTETEALPKLGPQMMYFIMHLRGASNQKAKRELGFHPRYLEWLEA